MTEEQFIPAKPKVNFILAMEWVNRMLMLPYLKIDVVLPPQDLARLEALPRSAGIFLASNHPSFSDPMVLFEVTRRWGRSCTWMAAREIFNRFGGWMGSFIRRTGAFSVLRGGDNEAAAKFAQRVLAERRFPIIVFPEGHTFYLNDVLLPLKPGVAAWAVDAACETAGLDVLIVPLAVKYHYIVDIQDSLDAATAEMERIVLRHAAPIPPGEFWSRLYLRLHRVADVLLTRQEKLHHYHPPPRSDIDQRVEGLCAHILEQLEEKYLGRRTQGDFFDRARMLMTYFKDEDNQVHQRDALDARFAWALSTFHAGYLSPDSTVERFAESVMKMQREITGRVPLSHRAWRQAHVRVGEPISVRSYLAACDEAARHDASHRILEALAENLRQLLTRLQQAQ